MNLGKSLVAHSAAVILLVVLSACQRPSTDQAAVTAEKTHPIQRPDDAASGEARKALSPDDFMLYRKADRARLDFLNGKGGDVLPVFGKPVRVVRSDPPSAKDIKEEKDWGWKKIVTTRLYYEDLFVMYDENENSGSLKELRIDDPAYESARGLSVGDLEQKLHTLYLIIESENLIFDLKDEVVQPAGAGLTSKAFRYSRYYKFEIITPPSSFYDRDESGTWRSLGMNFFVNKQGIITHIDYYHE